MALKNIYGEHQANFSDDTKLALSRSFDKIEGPGHKTVFIGVKVTKDDKAQRDAVITKIAEFVEKEKDSILGNLCLLSKIDAAPVGLTPKEVIFMFPVVKDTEYGRIRLQYPYPFLIDEGQIVTYEQFMAS